MNAGTRMGCIRMVRVSIGTIILAFQAFFKFGTLLKLGFDSSLPSDMSFPVMNVVTLRASF